MVSHGKKILRELCKWRSCGKPGKPKTGFPPFSQLLGNLATTARFPHFHSSGCLKVKVRTRENKEDLKEPAAQGNKSLKKERFT